jgi:hypothetical protein
MKPATPRRRAARAAAASAVLGLALCGPAAAQAAVGHPATHAAAGHPAARAAGGQRSAVAAASPCGQLPAPPAYKHVIIVMDENHSYSGIIGNARAPYVNSLASECGLASNYHNITHHSLPNYLGITSGLPLASLLGFDHDCLPSTSCEITSANLFSQAGSWKEYAESMPSNCYRSDSGDYAPKHNPAVYYTDLTDCGSNDVPLGTTGDSVLLQNFSSESTAPALAYVTGNLCDDMHGNTGCTTAVVRRGDTWLSKWIPRITATRVYRDDDTVIFLVWDEGEGGRAGQKCYTSATDQSCHIPAIVIAPSVKPGTVVPAHFDHYSVLKTTENLLGLPKLGQAVSAASMKAGFNL